MSGKNKKPDYGDIDGRSGSKLKPTVEKKIVDQIKTQMVFSSNNVNKRGVPYK